MKTRYLFLFVTSLFLFAACSDPLKQPINFDVSINEADTIEFVDTAFIVRVGTNVQFNFAGEPDFISFSYDRFLPTNAGLKFTTQPAWGTHIENTLALFVSDDFEGLTKEDFEKDSQAVSGLQWTDLSAEAEFPTAANETKTSTVSLNDYRGKKVVLAFRYKTTFADDWQPSWKISNLEVVNTRITDHSFVSSMLAATMGFSPFDIKNSEDAYKNAYESGVWFTEDPTEMTMRQTARNRDLNEDWLISKPISIPLGLVEKTNPSSVKNVTKRVESYSYKFENVGEYVVTFRAANHNYMNQSSVERVINIHVVD